MQLISRGFDFVKFVSLVLLKYALIGFRGVL